MPHCHLGKHIIADLLDILGDEMSFRENRHNAVISNT